MNFPRSSGVLLHPTSLPGPYGIGDLGPQAYAFADFLRRSGQSLWQVLPLGPTGYGDSPYACFSAFAGNTLLISPEQLVTEGLLSRSELPTPSPGTSERIDFTHAHALKEGLLRKAYEHYKRTTDTSLRSAFETFAQQSTDWLEDYALFRALKDAHDGEPWNKWEAALVRRTPAALSRVRDQLRDEIEAQMFYQFLFFRQWYALKNYCNEHG
ncbi:MAG TPA: 4-alpha-glucanotransferase, partial [Pyrinomonadaceae bacterium]|nr:4-alpha-glucanotransferase [Pyrinomonadaceae bacterium]